jgi:phosphatidylinositol alpha-1,6-mannosyltransferase
LALKKTTSEIATESRGMNILLLTDAFLPHAGGSRVYYYNLYRHLTEQFSDKVTILTKKVPGWKEFDSRASTDSLRLIRRYRPLHDLKYYKLPRIVPPLIDAVRLVRSNPVDLIHAGDLFPQGVIAMWIRKALGVPYVVYCHGEDLTQADHRRYQPRMRDAIYQCAERVIAANEFARRNLIRIGIPESKIVKILPGVDNVRFSPRPANPELVRRLGLQGKTVLLSVARLVARKGHSFVLQALARIRDKVPPFHYLIVGDGPEKTAISSLASELGLSKDLHLLGEVTDDQLPDFYRLCDLFVLANRDVEGDLEGFGMVFLEANAAGKPVVGGRTGGTSDAVLENFTGMLVDPENPDELAGALELLLNNPSLRYRLGNCGRERAVNEFCWHAQARLLRQTCLDIVTRQKTARLA